MVRMYIEYKLEQFTKNKLIILRINSTEINRYFVGNISPAKPANNDMTIQGTIENISPRLADSPEPVIFTSNDVTAINLKVLPSPENPCDKRKRIKVLFFKILEVWGKWHLNFLKVIKLKPLSKYFSTFNPQSLTIYKNPKKHIYLMHIYINVSKNMLV